jgi:hypothetical protein
MRSFIFWRIVYPLKRGKRRAIAVRDWIIGNWIFLREEWRRLH